MYQSFILEGFQHGLGNIHGPFVDLAVRCDDSMQVFNFRSVISQRMIRHVGHPASGLSENSFRATGIPQVCTVAGMHVQMRTPFANDADFQSNASGEDRFRYPQSLPDRLNSRGTM